MCSEILVGLVSGYITARIHEQADKQGKHACHLRRAASALSALLQLNFILPARSTDLQQQNETTYIYLNTEVQIQGTCAYLSISSLNCNFIIYYILKANVVF